MRDAKIQRMAEILQDAAREEGRSPTSIPGVDVFRMDQPTPLRATIYHPCLIIVAQGRKVAFLNQDAFEYSPSKYLVLPLSLPIDSRVLEASPEKPFLSFAIRIEPAMLGTILMESEPVGGDAATVERGIAASDMTEPMLDASLRLLECLDSPADARVLAPQIVRELLYRVLTGAQGGLLRAAAYHDGRLSQIRRALNLIHESYEEPIEVPQLARAAHMSPSSFYEAFKAVTSRSPLQYVKEIRLNRARQIILWEGVSAKRAASRVGYASDSQFSREFKRRFGRPPGKEREWALASGELAGARPY